MLHAVIMAGGIGARFWPKSRRNNPKQVIDLLGEGPMIQQTLRRISDIVSPENRWIVTNQEQADLFVKLIPELADARFIIEPMGRNTAPAIGLAAVRLLKEDPDAVMLVLPADHRIADHYAFRSCLLTAAEIVKDSEALATIGIEPTRPETGYGYIQIDRSQPQIRENVFPVKTFAEKPNPQTAKLFLESGEFFWNSGMFIWRADSIMRHIHDNLPDWYSGLQNIRVALDTDKEKEITQRVFHSNKGISIDYGVMENAQDVIIIKGNFGWSDVGSWDEVWRVRDHDAQGNALEGEAITVDASDNLILAKDKMIAVLGLSKLAVVETDDVILICPLAEAQRVRDIVVALEKKNQLKYL
ncbi:NTP transferase domain-containing protein [bacterium]|nr:NTP transferase domain-containing protein [bacterium]